MHAIEDGECPYPTTFIFFSFDSASFKISFSSFTLLGSKYRNGSQENVFAQFVNFFPFIPFIEVFIKKSYSIIFLLIKENLPF